MQSAQGKLDRSKVRDFAATPESWRDDRIESAIDESVAWLRKTQADDGHWAFELEADATIPSEYILLNHFLGEPAPEREGELARYLRAKQDMTHGGWPLYHDGDFDLSASVKAYYALKIVGDDPDAPHMKAAREAILRHGGAGRSNVFTRIALALFGQVPWRAVPIMPAQVMLFPRLSPFHIDRISYWSRTVMVPLMIVWSLRPHAVNPRGIEVQELFVEPPDTVGGYLKNPTGHWLGEIMLLLDAMGRFTFPIWGRVLARQGIDRALAFVRKRLNGEDGLGGIFPAMANTLMAFHALGISHDDPEFVIARKAVDKLLCTHECGETYCQPCVSPVWDTALASHALLEAGLRPNQTSMRKAMSWLREVQILDVEGDWISDRPGVRPGGWAFQYRNDYYPDVDDTAVVVMALHRADPEANREAIERGAEWVIGMQSRNGGWGAFNADNEHYILQHIPFADHGALLDPPSADVSARCISMLAQIGYPSDHPAVARSIAYLRREQEEDGSWFGRWGNNYVYGTWSVLNAFNAAGIPGDDPAVRRAVQWLKDRQREDGGWGEDCASYWQERRNECKVSTPSQTAWAILGLMAAGEIDSEAVDRGISFLLDAPRKDGKWEEHYFNAVGFPRVFYLRYHGYSGYFPLTALARYSTLKTGNMKTPAWGM